MCRRISWSASALVISSRESWPVSTGSSPLMPCAASPSAMAFTSRGCSLQKSAIWSNDSAVFSTSQTAVAFGISGIAMANLLCASPALRAKPVVISDDGYAPNIDISPPPVHRFRGLLDRPAWRAPFSGTSSVCKLENARKGRAMAVYTDVSAEDLADFLADYDLGELLSYKGIAEGVENSNFLVHATGGYFILTLYEKRVAPEDIPFFLALMEHLAARGLTCPQPVKNQTGDMLGWVAGRPAALVTFLDGMWIRRPAAAHCAALGEALAKLHLAGADFPMRRRNALSVDGWRPLYVAAAAGADSVQPGLRETIEREVTMLEGAWPSGLPEGVIHADLFPDNVFFLGDQLSGLIDFYFACTDTLAYDVAICLNAWCFELDHSYNVTKGRALLQGYMKTRPLNHAERDALQLLSRGACLRFLLTRLVDWLNVPPGALVRPKDPLEYFRKLRFHQAVTSARDYGIEI